MFPNCPVKLCCSPKPARGHGRSATPNNPVASSPEPAKSRVAQVDGRGRGCVRRDRASTGHQREVSNQTTLLLEELEALKGRLAAVQDQHDSVHNAAQNGHAYVLSIVAAVFLPLGFLTGLFGVNLGGMPGLDNPLAFLWLCFVMVGATLLAVVILRLNKWI
ncbi:CorA family divalent cation transporter [Ascidiaceihabitans sp.]|uniref:CorA family divalent cation transporter n=1 Tax=Ascidiaceihabitans sp. TaxID=1872644 RepID=UPI003297E2C3